MDHNTFDNIFTTDQLQMLKVLLPCLPCEKRSALAVFIKMQEFLYTLRYLQNSIPDSLRQLKAPDNEMVLCDNLLPYCNPRQKEQIRQFKQLTGQMDNIKEMMETIQMMQELFPQGGDTSTDSNGMQSPNGPDLSQIMEILQAMSINNENAENSADCEDANGTMDAG